MNFFQDLEPPIVNIMYGWSGICNAETMYINLISFLDISFYYQV